MTLQDWQTVIATLESAPLANMQHAVQRQQLIQKLQQHIQALEAEDPEGE